MHLVRRSVIVENGDYRRGEIPHHNTYYEQHHAVAYFPGKPYNDAQYDCRSDKCCEDCTKITVEREIDHDKCHTEIGSVADTRIEGPARGFLKESVAKSAYRQKLRQTEPLWSGFSTASQSAPRFDVLQKCRQESPIRNV